MGLLKKIKKVVTKVIVASMIGVSTITGFTSTAQAIVQPPRIEVQYETQVYKGKVYDGKPVEITVEDDSHTEEEKNKESTWDSVKRWVRHPIESTDKKIDDIKKDLTDDFKTYSEEAKENLAENIGGAFGTLQAKWIRECTKTMTEMFKFIMQSIVILPTDLVTNDALRSLYLKLLVVAVGLMAVFALYNCLVSMVDDENYIGFSYMIGRIFKAILFMMSSIVYFPLFILWTNQLSSGILSLAMKQVEMNVFFNDLNNGVLLSISGTLGSMVISVMMIIFLFQVFLHTCCRYWEMCKIFCTAPLAFAMSVIPSQDYIYISWKSKFKHIMFIQILYALHLAIFVAVMSVPFESKVLSVMIFIGGIWDLTKLPTGLDDIFRSNSANKTLGFGKQLLASLVTKKVPVAKAAKKATGK